MSLHQADRSGECTTCSDLEDEQQWGKGRHAPRSFPLKELQKSFLGKRTVQPFQSLSPAAAANSNTFPALLTLWAASSLLLKKRSFKCNASVSDMDEIGGQQEAQGALLRQHAAALEQVQAQMKERQQQQEAELLCKVEAQLSLQQQQHQVQEQRKQNEKDVARKQLNTMAVRTKCALGIDLSKPKYRPGEPLETQEQGHMGMQLSHTKHLNNVTPKDHQSGLAAATAILSSLSMLLGEAGHANAADQPGMEAGSHALAALCCDSISTATMNDFQHQVRTLSRASQALTEKGITPHDEVHKPGMLAAVSVLAALGGIKPAPKQEQEEDEDDGLYFQDQAATVDALITLSVQCQGQGKDEEGGPARRHSVQVMEILSNRLLANVGGNIKMPKPDFLGEGAPGESARPDGSCSLSQLDAMEARVKENQVKLACALEALGIPEDEAVKEPKAAAARASVTADAAQCQSLATQHATVQAQIAALEAEFRASQDIMTGALKALGFDRDAALQDPEAVAASATSDTNRSMSENVMRQHTELSGRIDGIDSQLQALGNLARQHLKLSDRVKSLDSQLLDVETLTHQHMELAGRVTSLDNQLQAVKELSHQHTELRDCMMDLDNKRQDFEELSHQHTELGKCMKGLDNKLQGVEDLTLQHTELRDRVRNIDHQLEGVEAGLRVALMALKIDKGNAACDPEAAAAAANLLSNGLLFKEVSDKLAELNERQEKGQAENMGVSVQEVLEIKGVSVQEVLEIKEALSEVGARLDLLETKCKTPSQTGGAIASVTGSICPSYLRNFEAHVRDRMEEQARSHEHLCHVIEVLVADANMVASLHGIQSSSQPSSPETNPYHFQPFTFTSVLQKYITYDGILERFAQNRSLRDVATKARTDTEACSKALQELETKFSAKHEACSRVLTKIAAQVDFLHNKIRDVAAGKTDKATRESSLPSIAKSPSGRPSLFFSGTSSRLNSMRQLFGTSEKSEAAVALALHEHEEEELQKRGSKSRAGLVGGSVPASPSPSPLSKSRTGLGWDLVAKYKARKKRLSDKDDNPSGSSNRSQL